MTLKGLLILIQLISTMYYIQYSAFLKARTKLLSYCSHFKSLK